MINQRNQKSLTDQVSQFRDLAKYLLIFFSCIFCLNSFGKENKHTSDFSSQINIEEQRLEAASVAMPDIFKQVNELKSAQISMLSQSESIEDLIRNASLSGESLWKKAKYLLKQTKSYDDRPLYWTRLSIKKFLKTNQFKFKISNHERRKALAVFERSSRGLNEINFAESEQKTNFKILITGFDPFLLDRNIYQSNPSGVTAMLLDGKTISYRGSSARIEAFMVPVRFSDFDQGMIEKELTPFYKENKVDLIATISMGRSNFDLERFPGKRRSSTAPDNLNVFTGANKENPIVPQNFGKNSLSGDEFVEFSLPVAQMSKAKGKFKIIDNHKVSTLNKLNFSAESLEQLSSETSVEGSGGGYLSNEISYRSINLRNSLKSNIPTGHIHTPRMKEFDKSTLKAISLQIESMLEHSLIALDKN